MSNPLKSSVAVTFSVPLLRDRQQGLTLIELMVGMVLGLLLMIGVVNVYIGNRQANQINEELSRMQDNARIAFELMAREVREAGGNPCGTPLVSNVLNGASGDPWLDWAAGSVLGVEAGVDLPGVTSGTGVGERVIGTDAFIVRSGSINDGVVITEHVPSSARFSVNTTAHGFVTGDILMVCDYRQAAIFQTTSASDSNSNVVHNTGALSPGNCSKGLGLPTVCTALGTPYTFNGGFISRLSSTAWYIGNNGSGGRSLFRAVGGVAVQTQEIAQGVQDLQVQYLTRSGATLATNYVDASAVTDWTEAAANRVVALRIVMTMQSNGSIGTDGQPLQRPSMHVVSLRHREVVE